MKTWLGAAGALLCVLLVMVFVPRIAQDIGYHQFADRRQWFGVPNFLNVVSNMPFLLVGGIGLWITLSRRSPVRFDDPWEKWPFAAFFLGTLMTAFGSSYYHLAPDNSRLVWDRLPMTVGFMGLLAAMLSERISVRAGRLLLAPLLVVGMASVSYWKYSEEHGVGDLRPYALVQFGTIIAIVVLMLVFPERYKGAKYMVWAFVLYLGAKLLEAGDKVIFSFGGIVSGHTLKHVAATGAVACVAIMLARRRAERPATGNIQ